MKKAATKNASRSPKTKSAKAAKNNLDAITSILEAFGFTELPDGDRVGGKDVAPKIVSDEEPNITKTQALSIAGHRAHALLYAEHHGVQGAQPLLAYRVERNSSKRSTCYYIDVHGIPKGAAEALAISAVSTSLTMNNIEGFRWRINCVGERESYAKFEREVTNHFKKHINELTAPLREAFKSRPLSLLSADHPTCKTIAAEAPQALNFLSESSREYFKEILEFIETTPYTYELDNGLIPEWEHEGWCITELAFEDEKMSQRVSGRGARYTNLSKKAGLRRDMPAFGLCIEIADSLLPKKAISFRKQPTLYLVHVGMDARRRSLDVLIQLISNKISAMHGMLKDKLSSQMMAAESSKASHILLIGQKEYVEKTVVVRNTVNRSEQVVPLGSLAEYIKKLK